MVVEHTAHLYGAAAEFFMHTAYGLRALAWHLFFAYSLITPESDYLTVLSCK